MLKQTLFSMIAILLLLPGVSLSQTDKPTPYNDADAYEVYSAILPMEWAVRVAKAKTLVIQAETDASFPMCLHPEGESEKIINEVIANYSEVNKKTWLIQNKFTIETPYKTISSDAISATLKKQNWQDFYKIYPDSGGFIKFSAAGFNADKTVALVFVAHSCGMMCGGGSYRVMKKKDGKWVPFDDWKGTRCSVVS